MRRRLEKNDLDRDFLKMLERKEIIGSHIRGGQVIDFGECPG